MTFCNHALTGGSCSIEHAFYIQIYNLIKGFLRILGKGSAFGYTGIVHQNINAKVADTVNELYDDLGEKAKQLLVDYYEEQMEQTRQLMEQTAQTASKSVEEKEKIKEVLLKAREVLEKIKEVL